MDINWRNDRITRQYQEDHADVLADLSAMTPFQLCEASTYCDNWENPFTEELVKRAGSYSQYSETLQRSDRIKIIQDAAKSFGIKLM